MAALDGHPAWDRYQVRTQQYVHSQISDIWVRFNPWRNWRGDLAAFNEPHTSEWYPVAYQVPELRLLINDVLAEIPPAELGGVLITKIPPGGEVAPHVDRGWHADYYQDKYAVQLKGNQQQAFIVDGVTLSAEPGEVYWFDNSRPHQVLNESDEERMTMIICTRPK